MYLTKYEIFKKSWFWSIVCGVIVGSFFWFITSLGSWFHSLFGELITFFDVFVVLSIVGCYFGAGYVGWRIVSKYYPSKAKRFKGTYIRYSIVSFLLLVAITFSPLAFFGVLWSLVAPFCVLQALTHVKAHFGHS